MSGGADKPVERPLTVEDIAEILGVSKRTVMRMLAVVWRGHAPVGARHVLDAMQSGERTLADPNVDAVTPGPA